MTNNRQLIINIVTNLISFVVSFGVSFFLTPFIVNKLGNEAYGFIGLSNNFVNYLQLVAVALNSMAARFIAIKIHEKNNEGANLYFSSILIANIVVSVFLTIIVSVFIIYLNNFINIPNNLIIDVRLLFLFIFLSFVFTVISSSFSIFSFVKNRLDIPATISIKSNILKAIILLFIFSYFDPRIWFLGIATIVPSIFVVISNFYYNNKLLPELKCNPKYFDYNAVKEVISSGIWNSLTKLSQILNTGLDLLIANIFIGSASMGILAIAKTIPNFIQTFVGTLTSVFLPTMTKLYAEGKHNELANNVQFSIKLLGVIASLPIAGLMAFGDIFYSLWMPGQDAILLQILSIITIGAFAVSVSLEPLYNIFVVTNKLKVNTLITLLSGIISTILVLILLELTNLGVYAIAATSTVIGIIRSLTFLPIYSAKLLEIKSGFFYIPLLKNLFSIIIVTIIGFLIREFLYINSWKLLFLAGLILFILGILINIILIINRSEKRVVLDYIKNKLNSKQ